MDHNIHALSIHHHQLFALAVICLVNHPNPHLILPQIQIFILILILILKVTLSVITPLNSTSCTQVDSITAQSPPTISYLAGDGISSTRGINLSHSAQVHKHWHWDRCIHVVLINKAIWIVGEVETWTTHRIGPPIIRMSRLLLLLKLLIGGTDPCTQGLRKLIQGMLRIVKGIL